MPSAKIRQLDPHVANQIAAGEVVERPSSVVKELLENSLDAGATAVTLHLDEGGRARIRVVDNGHGMGPEDAQLAFARHATSKITAADELMRIGSYGFRGEALASILSVARVTLITRRAEDELGVRITGGGDAALATSPVAAPVGTDLCIDDLFFNVPARQKFLRTAATELGHVLRLIDAVALARPSVSWTLVHNGKTLCDYPAAESLEARARKVFDAELAPRLYTFASQEDYAVEGLLSDPDTTRGSPSGLTFLVDGRPVRDKTLQHAVVQAYGTLLDRRRFPVGVLHLRCPPGTVDVNVHPAKTEVRFVSSQAVHRAVGRAVRGMLAATPWLQPPLLQERASPYNAEASGAPEPAAATPRHAASWEQPRRQRATPAPWAESRSSSRGAADPRAGAGRPARPVGEGHPTWPRNVRGWGAAPPAARSVAPPHGGPPHATPTSTASAAGGADATLLGDVRAASALNLGAARYVGQVGARYLVLDTPSGVALVDQHAAHERALQLQFGAQLSEGALPAQRLMIPRVVALGPMAAATLLGHDALTSTLGFELAPAGERSVLVRTSPDVLRPDQIEPSLRALASDLVAGALGHAPSASRAATALACQAAVRAGDAVTPAWAQRVLTALADEPLERFCPHGSPALSFVAFADLAGAPHDAAAVGGNPTLTSSPESDMAAASQGGEGTG